MEIKQGKNTDFEEKDVSLDLEEKINLEVVAKQPSELSEEEANFKAIAETIEIKDYGTWLSLELELENPQGNITHEPVYLKKVPNDIKIKTRNKIFTTKLSDTEDTEVDMELFYELIKKHYVVKAEFDPNRYTLEALDKLQTQCLLYYIILPSKYARKYLFKKN